MAESGYLLLGGDLHVHTIHQKSKLLCKNQAGWLITMSQIVHCLEMDEEAALWQCVFDAGQPSGKTPRNQMNIAASSSLS